MWPGLWRILRSPVLRDLWVSHRLPFVIYLLVGWSNEDTFFFSCKVNTLENSSWVQEHKTDVPDDWEQGEQDSTQQWPKVVLRAVFTVLDAFFRKWIWRLAIQKAGGVVWWCEPKKVRKKKLTQSKQAERKSKINWAEISYTPRVLGKDDGWICQHSHPPETPLKQSRDYKVKA